MYYFKNKNMVLAELSKVGDHFEIVNLYCDCSKIVLFMLRSNDALNTWIDNRQTAIDRPYAIELFKQAGIKSRVDFVDISLCLSVTDTFWITLNYKQNWESVSLFRNSFTKVYTDIASGMYGFNGRRIKSPSPELGIDGNSKKCFKRYNSIISLYKTSGGLAELQYSGVYSEFLASQFLRALGIPFNKYTSYSIINYNNCLWSKCNLFTSDNIGLIAIEDIFDDFEHLEEHICHYKGAWLNDFKLLMIIDSLLLNVDRHGENISLIYDNNTFNILGLSPIYDFDHSLFYDVSLLNRSKDYIIEKVLCKFPRTYHSHLFEDQLKFCMTDLLYNRLLSLYKSDFRFVNNDKFPMSSDRLDMINKVFKWNFGRLLRKV